MFFCEVRSSGSRTIGLHSRHPTDRASPNLSGGNTKTVTAWFYCDRKRGPMAAAGASLGRASPQGFSGILEHWIEQSTDYVEPPLSLGFARTTIHFGSWPLSRDMQYELTQTRMDASRPITPALGENAVALPDIP